MSKTRITSQQLDVVKQTAGAVVENISKITSTFYGRMLSGHPELMSFFNRTNQRDSRQQQALACSVVAAAQNIENLNAIDAPLNAIAHKHCALGIRPDQYQIVHDDFLGAVAEVLGDAVTPPVADAWSAVLMTVAGDLIDRESALYNAAAARPGGWRDTKTFVIKDIKAEHGGQARSLYLEPADGSKTPQWTPGQYVTVCNNPLAGDELCAPRHYTVSHHSKLRITCKLDSTPDQPAGLMSSFLHERKVGDTLELRPPFGEFGREKRSDTEIYVSGGIGVTPAVAMSGAASADPNPNSLYFFHVSDNGSHPLCDEIELDAQHKFVGDRSQLDRLESLLADGLMSSSSSADMYVCGPVPFMQQVKTLTDKFDLGNARVQYEAFGPRPILK